MSKCEKCGSEIDDGATVCPECGAERSEPKTCDDKKKTDGGVYDKWRKANGFNAFLARAGKMISASFALLAALFCLVALLPYMTLIVMSSDPFIPLTITFLVLAAVWQTFADVYAQQSMCSLAEKDAGFDLRALAAEQTSYAKGGNIADAEYIAGEKSSYPSVMLIAERVLFLAGMIVAVACLLPVVGFVFAYLVNGTPADIPDYLLSVLARLIVGVVLTAGLLIASKAINGRRVKTVLDRYSKEFGKILPIKESKN